MRRIIVGIFISVVTSVLSAQEPASRDNYLERMEQEHATDVPSASPAAQVAPQGEIAASNVVYATVEGTQIEGHLARPSTAGSATAGIIVIHEWWGLNDNIRAMAHRLAGEGYVALAVDLYEGEVGESREEAGRLARESREKVSRLQENLRQAWHYLRQEAGVSSIGVIGWCFGGGWSLQTALMLGDDIDAAVIYYGRLVTDASELESLSSPLLGIFGAEDQGIPVATVREFQTTLASLGKDAAIHIYERADHAFANPSGTRYNPAAAEDAWGKTLSFLNQHLRR